MVRYCNRFVRQKAAEVENGTRRAALLAATFLYSKEKKQHQLAPTSLWCVVVLLLYVSRERHLMNA